MADVVVQDNETTHRFEAYLGDQLAGHADYELSDGVITFTHTVVFDDHEGQGVGGSLARSALDAVRAAGERRVVAQCSFIRSWIDKHPDYQDLLAT